MLNELENKVIQLIRENPFASQQDMANSLGIPRSTLAGVISGLVQKKFLLGKAYVINDSPFAVCIGAMNVDRKFALKDMYRTGTSNPVTSTITVGGVARNIAENLGRLGIDVKMISLAGQDQDFEIVKTQTQSFVSMQFVNQINKAATSSYTAIIDNEGEMITAFADMEICEHMTVEWLETHSGLIGKAKLIIVDLNLKMSSVDWLIKFANKHEIPLMLVPVSEPKMKHLPDKFKKIDWLIVNRGESLTYFHIENQEVTTEELAQKWLDAGVRNVLITQGSKEIVFANQEGVKVIETLRPDKVIDVTGAGDALVAGIMYGIYHEFDNQKAIELGLVNATKTIQSPHTVRLDLNQEKLEKEWKKYYQ